MPVTCVVVADELLIYNWARNLGADTDALFENKTGHKIREAHYDNEGDRNRNILSANAINYDIFILDSDGRSLW
ncbi:MAG: hypothetical protein ACI90U_002653 [Pseudomonadales bacterium]|jgi:hypothetical protein